MEAPRGPGAGRPDQRARRTSGASRGSARYGGKLSSEWELAKGLQLLEEDPELYARTDRWIEAADWIVWQLCGTYVRNACTAGYKARLPGRRLPVAASTSPRSTRGFAGFVDDKVDAADRRRSATAPAG